MVLKKDELLEKIKAYVGDRTDDETISLIEDVTDTIKNDDEDWKKKYEELDSDWRRKYKDRFFNSAVEEKIIEEKQEDEETENYEDLFNKKEE